MTEPNHTQPANTTDLAPATTEKPKRLQRRYTEEDVHRGLTELALCNGNYRLAQDRLTERGYDLPGETIRKWAINQHADRYQHLRGELVPRIHAQIAAQAEDTARAALEAQALAIERTHTLLENPNVKAPSTIARDLATVAGIMIDKANLQRGRPTQITETRDIAGILKSLEANIPGIHATNTTAVELTTEDNSEAPQRVQSAE